jgi:2-keto-4-pentenoate hydratase/2-oxohepta-3-ene-1,7-dioic acid hydratase in catechol pathway
MKLVRFGEPGRERPGLIDPAGRLRDLSAHVSDIGDKTLLPDYMTAIRRASPSTLPVVEGDVRLGPCVTAVGKIVGIGLNYTDLLDAIGLRCSDEPTMFLKATSAICGPRDNLILPAGSKNTDWGVELALVIGRPGQNIAVADALDHVAGYCIVNDYSERIYGRATSGSTSNREIQQWSKGKSSDTFAPLGPWLVTPDEIPNPEALDIWLEVDGRRYQESNTSHMIFGIAEIVSTVSAYMSLQTGDVIMTGTPFGTGISHSPQVYLRPGQKVCAFIDGLGEQCQTVSNVDGDTDVTDSEPPTDLREPEYDWQAIYSPSP